MIVLHVFNQLPFITNTIENGHTAKTPKKCNFECHFEMLQEILTWTVWHLIHHMIPLCLTKKSINDTFLKPGKLIWLICLGGIRGGPLALGPWVLQQGSCKVAKPLQFDRVVFSEPQVWFLILDCTSSLRAPFKVSKPQEYALRRKATFLGASYDCRSGIMQHRRILQRCTS